MKKENEMSLNSKAKANVLNELIKAMEDRELGELKGKSPKFAKVDIQSDDPKLAEALKNKLTGVEETDDEESSESPEEKMKELTDPSLESKESSSEDDDDLERLKELYSKLK
jgi:hypothetical protein